VDTDERGDIAQALGNFADDEATIRALVALQDSTGMSEEVYAALQKISHRAGRRILVPDVPGGTPFVL
jgi:hypothetical protein